jgi:hypothetical protein
MIPECESNDAAFSVPSAERMIVQRLVFSRCAAQQADLFRIKKSTRDDVTVVTVLLKYIWSQWSLRHNSLPSVY